MLLQLYLYILLLFRVIHLVDIRDIELFRTWISL